LNEKPWLKQSGLFYLLLFMQEQHLTINFKARYFKLGEITSQTKAVWFVLHGYGHLAQFFIKKFEPLVSHDICVIAPEGLSKFYLEDVNARVKTGNNRVGATWMTRENRLVDIENYTVFLNAVYTSELKQHADIPVTLLGFSQGAATVSRWAMHNSVTYDKLILWSGIFPDDMDFEKGKELLTVKTVHQVYGNNDPFLNEERLKEMRKLCEKLGIVKPPIVFEGGHEIHEQTLLSLI
jgi:predicted esterase